MSTYSFSTAVANAALGIFNGTAPTTYSTVYMQLHTGAPGASGTSNVSAGSTTRPSVTLGTAASGTITATGTPSWTNGGTSETITAVSFWSAASSGTFLHAAQLTTPQAWASGNVLQLPTVS